MSIAPFLFLPFLLLYFPACMIVANLISIINGSVVLKHFKAITGTTVHVYVSCNS